MFDQFAYECPRCQIGHCHAGKTTYTRVLQGHVISIPNIAVYTCDVCGYQEFDREALLRLQTLMGANNHNPLEDTRPAAKSASVEPVEKAKSPRPKP